MANIHSAPIEYQGLTQLDLFVFRRAFRSSRKRVTRHDVLRAFHISNTKASECLSMASQSTWGTQLLVRAPRYVGARATAEPPVFAGEADLLEHLRRGLTRPRHLGLFPDELPINWGVHRRADPPAPGVTATVLRAIVTQRPLNIAYIGMRRGDRGTERWIVPIGVDIYTDQIRLVAHDLNQAGFALRSYVLSRIVAARACDRRLPKGFCRESAYDPPMRCKARLSEELTPEQARVARHELRIDDHDELMVSRRYLHDLGRLYASRAVADNVVWPPLRMIEPV
jgi:WYL domain